MSSRIYKSWTAFNRVSASCLARLALIANILPDQIVPNINTTLFNNDSGRSKFVLEFTLSLEKVNVVPRCLECILSLLSLGFSVCLLPAYRTATSLVPRPIRAMRVSGGEILLTSLTGDVTSQLAGGDWERVCTATVC